MAIIPRWEWRTFGEHFGAAEDAFRALVPGQTHESDEVYLLSQDQAGRADIVKIRDGLLDVKQLREVSAEGLERWEPVLKAGFPLSPDNSDRVAQLLHVPAQRPGPADNTLEQFLADISVPTGPLRPVRVHKRRVRYVVGGCTAELSDVVAEGRSSRTIAIESPDAAAVLAAVRSVHLEGYLNTNYPRGLEAILEGRPPRYAVIDVGTNSVKFQVAERRPGGGWRVLIDRADVTRLGEGIHERGEISPQALERTITAIKAMAQDASSQGAVAIAAVGTAGLRAATNRDAVIAAIRTGTGVAVEVIPGEEEGRLAYKAVQTAMGAGAGADHLAVFDTGGGSTQFTFGHAGRVDEQFSLPVGAVALTERFGLDRAVTQGVLDKATAAISVDLARIDNRPPPDALVGMGGAMTNIAAVMHNMAVYDPEVVQGTVLDRAEIDRQIELYRSLDADGRRAIVGLQPKRAEVILAGACLVRTVMSKLGQTSLTVSDRGLRHGLLDERFGQL